MSDSSSRVQRLITRYFNQLLHGCRNPHCQNPNCASSARFEHAHLTPNQAAVLAVRLTSEQAQLCYPADQSSESLANVMSSSSTDDDHAAEDPKDDPQPRAQSPAGSSTSSVVPGASRRFNSNTLSSALAAEESSRSGFLTPGEVTRLLMFLFNASDNEDVTATTLDDGSNSSELISGHSPLASSLGSSSFGRLGARETLASGGANARLSSRTPFSDAYCSCNTNADSLKSSFASPNAGSSIGSFVSPGKTSQERELRTEGLTLSELKSSIELGQSQGNWSHLISLLSAIFSSYEALSSSFPEQTTEDENPHHAEAKKLRISGSLADRTLKKSGFRSMGVTRAQGGDTESAAPRFCDLVRTPMDLDRDPGGDLTSKTTPMHVRCPSETERNREIVGNTPLLDLSSTSSHRVPMELDHSATDDDEDEIDAVIVPVASTTSISKPVPPASVTDVRTAWSMIAALQERQQVVDALMRAVRRLVVISLHKLFVTEPPEGLGDPTPCDAVRETQQRLINLFFILYECPFATDPLHFEHLLPNINRAATWLPILLQARLCRIWANAVQIPLPNCTEPPNPEQTNLWNLQKILLQHITLRCMTTGHGVPNEDKQICEAALVLRIVYFASLLAGQMDSAELLNKEAEENREFELQLRSQFGNSRRRRNRITSPEDPLAKALGFSPNDCRKPFIPAKDFVNDTLNEGLRPKQDYVNYRSRDPLGDLSFMRLPFLLQTSSKTMLLYYDNRMRMLDERRGAIVQSLLAGNPQLPFFKLHISRERIVEDALLGLEIACIENPTDLKKQLLIEFEGEQGIDEGGLSKEFFELIIEKIFDPVYGMFVLDEELQTYWFNPVPLEDLDREYCLIGILLGLAIYNDIILDVHFPSVLYRKLCGKLGTYEDLKDARPDLIPGLQALLDYEEDDIEDAFGCFFVIYYQDLFGNTLSHELKPNGASIPVTKENRQEFVDLYAGFLLNDSVKKQFAAFRRGFQMVVDESPLTFLFRPDEIELLVRGSQDYDFHELERVTTYEDYTSDSSVIKNFWTVVHSMTEEQQRQLLQFTTGSDRIPVGGMSKMKFTIARQGADEDRLPTAHTCFNILLLPDYQSLEQLKHLLLIAITYSKGFGMS
ncbi:unnamed protein product [Calicophoron daubneyi]|uniref:HECT-type E3 ubiquitin transferase n=1 Tax=Calicophoron daubneyi TaxID=300641 RepID=A0AAV2THJ1_CALDB